MNEIKTSCAPADSRNLTWDGEIYQIITNHTSYRRVLKQKFGEQQEAPKKKHWWSRR